MNPYTPEALQICSTVARSLQAESGVWGPKCIVIGGLAPALLNPELPEGLQPHIGTTDVDLGIHVAAVGEEKDLYRTLKDVLRSLDFKQQSDPSYMWTRNVNGANVELELFCNVDVPEQGGRIQRKPIDRMGANVSASGIYGLSLIERDIVEVESDGPLLDEKGNKRVTIRVCGPAMLMILKGFALKERTKLKDGYDVVWILRAFTPETVANRFRLSNYQNEPIGQQAIQYLLDEFGDFERTGPRGWSSSCGFVGDEDVRERRTAAAIVQEFCRLAVK